MSSYRLGRGACLRVNLGLGSGFLRHRTLGAVRRFLLGLPGFAAAIANFARSTRAMMKFFLLPRDADLLIRIRLNPFGSRIKVKSSLQKLILTFPIAQTAESNSARYCVS